MVKFIYTFFFIFICNSTFGISGDDYFKPLGNYAYHSIFFICYVDHTLPGGFFVVLLTEKGKKPTGKGCY